ncbi:TrbI F-type domain-containing protein [Arsenophonus sp.]|nr:TrbI F-type domain-containing protein [Arsenophonus sp.]MDR5610308.1 TrbI F-type domain-containing protein [Arsenophonus sp.]MDR5614110.1 TrbI F-type domain-containing protein [Arsenophonus sp.]
MKKTAILKFIASSLLIALLIVSAQYWLFPPTNIVTFDMKKTTDRFLLQVSKLDLSDEKKDQLIERYNNTLKRVLEKNIQGKTVILVNSAVMAGAVDKTADIQKQIAEAMKNHE